MEPEPGSEPVEEDLTLWGCWPVPVALFFASVFNLSWLMGVMKALGVPDQWYFGVALVASQAEMGWWYHFFGWLPRSVAKVSFVRRYVHEWVEAFKLAGFPQQINSLVDLAKPTVQSLWAWFLDEVDEMLNPPTGFRRRFFTGTIVFLRAAWRPVAFVALVALGAVPQANIVFGMPVCRAMGLRWLPALMIGNLMTIYTTDKVVDGAFWLWAFLPWPARALLGLAVVGFFIVRHRRRMARKQKAVSL